MRTADLSGAAAPSTTITGAQRAWNKPTSVSRNDSPRYSQQRLGRAHAARFAGGQNEPGGHCEHGGGRDFPANTESESVRQLDAALRRTAIISAATAMAISSGEMAPMSRPMGA